MEERRPNRKRAVTQLPIVHYPLSIAHFTAEIKPFLMAIYFVSQSS